jgi:hypothetical protein
MEKWKHEMRITISGAIGGFEFVLESFEERKVEDRNLHTNALHNVQYATKTRMNSSTTHPNGFEKRQHDLTKRLHGLTLQVHLMAFNNVRMTRRNACIA